MLMSFYDVPRNTTHVVPHTVYVSQARAASVAAEEQEGDSSDVETALAALAGESDIDLEGTDVQEILLAF